MKKILIVTDFSDVSKNATLYAIEIAKLSDAKILLYDCGVDHVSLAVPNPPLLSLPSKSDLALKRLIELNALKQLSDLDFELLTTDVTCIHDILAIEKKEDPDLVIIGLKEPEHIEQSAIDDIIIALIKETTVPILIVPENAGFKKIEKIVFAIDFNLEIALTMHKSVKYLLEIYKPEIFLLNVVKENEEIRPDKKKSEDNVERYFENMKHIYSFIQHNDMVKGLQEFIANNKIDVITMLPHKHSLFQSIFVESQTTKMAMRTNIPLIIFPMDK